MGNKQIWQKTKQFSKNFKKRYVFVKEVADPRFGDVQIYKNSDSDIYVMAKAVWCPDSKECSRFLDQANERLNIYHENVIQLMGYHGMAEENICGDFDKFTVYVEYYTHALDKEIEKKRQMGVTKTLREGARFINISLKVLFSEQEIWFILDSLISACAYLEEHKVHHGDIRPYNVLLAPNGMIKIADPGLLINEQSGYTKTMIRREFSYLAPTLLNQAFNKKIKPYHDPYRSDVFSLGMTMLELVNLSQPAEFYDKDCFTISSAMVEQTLALLSTRYSPLLRKIIEDMLQPNESIRSSFLQLNAFMLPHRENVRKFLPFETTLPLRPFYSSLKERKSELDAVSSSKKESARKSARKASNINSSSEKKRVQFQIEEPADVLIANSGHPPPTKSFLQQLATSSPRSQRQSVNDIYDYNKRGGSPTSYEVINHVVPTSVHSINMGSVSNEGPTIIRPQSANSSFTNIINTGSPLRQSTPNRVPSRTGSPIRESVVVRPQLSNLSPLKYSPMRVVGTDPNMNGSPQNYYRHLNLGTSPNRLEASLHGSFQNSRIMYQPPVLTSTLLETEPNYDFNTVKRSLNFFDNSYKRFDGSQLNIHRPAERDPFDKAFLNNNDQTRLRELDDMIERAIHLSDMSIRNHYSKHFFSAPPSPFNAK